jgi:hypothetical protein
MRLAASLTINRACSNVGCGSTTSVFTQLDSGDVLGFLRKVSCAKACLDRVRGRVRTLGPRVESGSRWRYEPLFDFPTLAIWLCLIVAH